MEWVRNQDVNSLERELFFLAKFEFEVVASGLGRDREGSYGGFVVVFVGVRAEEFLTGDCRCEDEGLDTAVLTRNEQKTTVKECSSHRSALTRLHRRTPACPNDFKARVSIAA